MSYRCASILLVFALVASACAQAEDKDKDGTGGGTADAAGPVADGGPTTDAPLGPVFPDAAPAGYCGDGNVSEGEVCDHGGNPNSHCAADCKSVLCNFDKSFVDPTTHRCFWRSTDVVNRDAAASACAAQGGYLVRWHTHEERDAAYPVTVGGPGGRVWVGARKVGSVWTWDDGRTAGPELNFRSGEPSGDGNCTEWGSSNNINDIPCNANRDYVCTRDP